MARCVAGLPDHPQEHFCAHIQRIWIKLVNARGRRVIGVAAQSGDGPPAAYAYGDLPAGSTQEMPVGWTPSTRGWHDLPMVTAETRFPLGTFPRLDLLAPPPRACWSIQRRKPGAGPAVRAGNTELRAGRAPGLPRERGNRRRSPLRAWRRPAPDRLAQIGQRIWRQAWVS